MSRLTKLDAVNNVLASAGKRPVNTIDGPTTADAAIAVRLVEAVQREICSQGWHWNTEYLVSLEVDISTGTIPVPSSYLRVVVPDAPYIIQRGAVLYDRSAHSDQFEDAQSCTVVKYLEWDSLPEEAKVYIWTMSAVRYYQGFIGADASLNLLRSQAFIAESNLKNMDADDGRYSIFDSPDMAAGLQRGNMYVPGATFMGRDNLDDRTPK